MPRSKKAKALGFGARKEQSKTQTTASRVAARSNPSIAKPKVITMLLPRDVREGRRRIEVNG